MFIFFIAFLKKVTVFNKCEKKHTTTVNLRYPRMKFKTSNINILWAHKTNNNRNKENTYLKTND